jgi:hypothetical protein
VDENTAVVDFMTPSGNYFKWPPKNDVQTVYTDGALSELKSSARFEEGNYLAVCTNNGTRGQSIARLKLQ